MLARGEGYRSRRRRKGTRYAPLRPRRVRCRRDRRARYRAVQHHLRLRGPADRHAARHRRVHPGRRDARVRDRAAGRAEHQLLRLLPPQLRHARALHRAGDVPRHPRRHRHELRRRRPGRPLRLGRLGGDNDNITFTTYTGANGTGSVIQSDSFTYFGAFPDQVPQYEFIFLAPTNALGSLVITGTGFGGGRASTSTTSPSSSQAPAASSRCWRWARSRVAGGGELSSAVLRQDLPQSPLCRGTRVRGRPLTGVVPPRRRSAYSVSHAYLAR
jgi:hypothetical protein